MEFTTAEFTKIVKIYNNLAKAVYREGKEDLVNYYNLMMGVMLLVIYNLSCEGANFKEMIDFISELNLQKLFESLTHPPKKADY